MVEALLFDLDGTLVDSALDITRALTVMVRERGGGKVSLEQVRDLVSGGAETLVAGCLGPLARDKAADLVRFRVILSGLTPSPEMIYPGVVAALAQLTDAGHRCGVVTNKPEGLARQLLHALGLARYFPVIVGGDTLHVGKPDPAPLHYALSLLGCASGRAIMIGDSAVDCAAAAAAELSFALFDHGYGAAALLADLPAGTREPARFADFDALPSLIMRLT